ncbi:hypothetical protein CcaverHIS002_0210790 [Cutaneotrichosporon cavernicola]|nr:hypothetical protein CcaverHIS002_0210790 [Cutaneotrichosporon cavernicola]BEI97488.1 hypothetical protein CcaverHIS631_0210770 [Cutaneotrichosporon cavernicola]BEJ05266.1 hypothetical protein CcaverHIS641_0210830 [Cutaneotrichosporon cavernicola]
MSDDKASIQASLKDDYGHNLAVEVPASIAALTEPDRIALDKAATRKVDILLMPALVVLYILNYLDRQNISTAKIGGMTTDLGMTAQQFSTCVAVLFAGYVSLQIPSNIIASKVTWPSTYICLMCGLWGAVSACTGAVNSYAGMAICRTILGFTEAAFFPGALYLLSMFYTKEQLALRTAILYSGSQLGNAFGGLFALACLQLDGAHGLEGWRWLFIVEGVMTVGFAIIFATYMPNRPESMRWLSPIEREQLLYRLAADRGTKDGAEEMGQRQAIRLAFTDIKVWLVGITLTIAYVAAAVTNFFPIVVNGLGFNRTTTLAITAPPYILCILVINLNGFHSDKKRERTWHIIGPFFVTILANVIAVATTNIGARYFAMMLMPASFYSASIVLLSWISTTVVGPHTKRAVAIAIINAVSNTSNIWTSYLYTGAPRYTLAFAVNLAASVVVVLLVLVTRWYLARLNAKLERGEDLGKQGPSAVQIEAGFRFVL